MQAGACRRSRNSSTPIHGALISIALQDPTNSLRPLPSTFPKNSTLSSAATLAAILPTHVMPPRNQHPSEIYAHEMLMLKEGHGLWFPEPHKTGMPQMGDVGFFTAGAFRRLFSLNSEEPEHVVISPRSGREFRFATFKTHYTEELANALAPDIYPTSSVRRNAAKVGGYVPYHSSAYYHLPSALPVRCPQPLPYRESLYATESKGPCCASAAWRTNNSLSHAATSRTSSSATTISGISMP